MEDVCTLHQETLKEHDKRLILLEIENGVKTERITALCSRIDELVKQIERMVNLSIGVLLTSLATTSGFIIWYIQKG
ncbi:MAG: hypothetical protein CVU90_02060 [Firmicutes bacterium HGW-Firmicutes-15]|nr:MAG: hypothetical protein CVU90_02060 [Firmicutes bacterium HGW-Firmicutes-15]